MSRETIGVAISIAVAASALAVRINRPVPLIAQQQACLHGADETAEQRDRRWQALQTARQINTAEARQAEVTRSYVPVSSLNPAPTVPAGFKVALTADGASYVFSVKDTLDPCRFAYFSDQEGVIFESNPIR